MIICSDIFFINFVFMLHFSCSIIFMLFLDFMFHQRISKHQLSTWTIAGVKKKESVNNTVANVSDHIISANSYWFFCGFFFLSIMMINKLNKYLFLAQPLWWLYKLIKLNSIYVNHEREPKQSFFYISKTECINS